MCCLSSRLIGKVNSEHGTCYVPFGKTEVPNPSYEILVALSSSRAAPTNVTTTSATTSTTETSPILVTHPLKKIVNYIKGLKEIIDKNKAEADLKISNLEKMIKELKEKKNNEPIIGRV